MYSAQQFLLTALRDRRVRRELRKNKGKLVNQPTHTEDKFHCTRLLGRGLEVGGQRLGLLVQSLHHFWRSVAGSLRQGVLMRAKKTTEKETELISRYERRTIAMPSTQGLLGRDWRSSAYFEKRLRITEYGFPNHVSHTNNYRRSSQEKNPTPSSSVSYQA